MRTGVTVESGQESRWSQDRITVESGQESRWSQSRSHGGVRTGVTVESRRSHGGVRAGVTVESCVWEARHHVIRNVFWSRNSKMGSLKLGRGEIYWIVGRMVYFD